MATSTSSGIMATASTIGGIMANVLKEVAATVEGEGVDGNNAVNTTNGSSWSQSPSRMTMMLIR